MFEYDGVERLWVFAKRGIEGYGCGAAAITVFAPSWYLIGCLSNQFFLFCGGGRIVSVGWQIIGLCVCVLVGLKGVGRCGGGLRRIIAVWREV